MGIYQLKMYIKRLGIVKCYLNKRSEKENNEKNKMLKKEGLLIIQKVEQALKTSGLCYFADYGTLLGIIRDHDFIKWDLDIDYGLIVGEEFDWKYFERNMNSHGFTKKREFILNNKISEQTYSCGNLTVDFFGHTLLSDKMFGHIFFRKQDYIYKSKYDFHVDQVSYSKVTTTKSILFNGIQVTVPTNSEKYLESIYSSNWRTPVKDWVDPNTDGHRVELSVFGKMRIF